MNINEYFFQTNIFTNKKTKPKQNNRSIQTINRSTNNRKCIVEKIVIIYKLEAEYKGKIILKIVKWQICTVIITFKTYIGTIAQNLTSLKHSSINIINYTKNTIKKVIIILAIKIAIWLDVLLNKIIKRQHLGNIHSQIINHYQIISITIINNNKIKNLRNRTITIENKVIIKVKEWSDVGIYRENVIDKRFIVLFQYRG